MGSCPSAAHAGSTTPPPPARPLELPSAVRLRLVAEEVRRYARRTGKASPRVLDMGCADRAAERCLADAGVAFTYCGLDSEPGSAPDVWGDARALEAQRSRLPWTPDVILLIDVLARLDGRYADIQRALRGARSVLAEDGLVLISVPQMQRLDRLKLPHLGDPRNTVRFTLDEWLALIGQELAVEGTQGSGYLSVLPALPLLAPVYREGNALGRAHRLLRGKVFAWERLQGADTWLSNTVGRVKGLDGWASDALIVCRRR